MAYCMQPHWRSRGSHGCLERQGSLQAMTWLIPCECHHLLSQNSDPSWPQNVARPSIQLCFCLMGLFVLTSRIALLSHPEMSQLCKLCAFLSAWNLSWSAWKKIILNSILPQVPRRIWALNFRSGLVYHRRLNKKWCTNLSRTIQEALLEFTSWIMKTFAGAPGIILRVTVIW